MSSSGNAVIRKATVHDVPVIARIVNHHAAAGVMLPRPVSRIYDNVRDYTVVEVDGRVIGCGALHVMWSDLAEIRAVAVEESYIGSGFGRHIVQTLLDEAVSLEVDRVFVLTYREGFFRHMGFADVDKADLPHKIWSDCINCVHFPNCDEIALIRDLAER